MIVGNAQKHCATDLGNVKSIPSGVTDRFMLSGWRENIALSRVSDACSKLKVDKRESNHDNFDFDEGRQVRSFFQWRIIIHDIREW